MPLRPQPALHGRAPTKQRVQPTRSRGAPGIVGGWAPTPSSHRSIKCDRLPLASATVVRVS